MIKEILYNDQILQINLKLIKQMIKLIFQMICFLNIKDKMNNNSMKLILKSMII